MLRPSLAIPYSIGGRAAVREPRRWRGQGSPPSVDTGRDVRGTTALAAVLLLLPVVPAPAETFLVVVTETDGGEPSQPPLAAREGIFSALFDGEHIGFEFPAGELIPSTDALLTLAVEAGAGTVALVVVDWRQERLVGGALRVSGRGGLVLVDARSGAETARVPLAVANEGREQAADRRRLGVEVGIALIAAYRTAAAVP
jgi:hypothetical protein